MSKQLLFKKTSFVERRMPNTSEELEMDAMRNVVGADDERKVLLKERSYFNYSS